jgi:anti-sigma regulatory factor (Ser/Thr protein kinase)
MDPSKYIDVAMEIGTEEFVAIVKDEGKGLSKKRFRDMVESSADLESSTGRGIRIVHRLSDKLRLFKDEKGKFCIKAVKKLNSQPILAENR